MQNGMQNGMQNLHGKFSIFNTTDNLLENYKRQKATLKIHYKGCSIFEKLW